MDWTESAPLGEGELEDVFARHGVVFAALPDSKTVVCLQYAETTRRIYLQSIKGLGLKMPNDLFNDFKRKYVSADGSIELKSCPGKEKIIKLKSPWLNIDNCLSVFNIYGDEHFTIYRTAERQIKVKGKSALRSLYADEICSQFTADGTIVPPNKNLIDTGAVLMTGIDAAETRKINDQQRWQIIDMGPGIRAVEISDTNNQRYRLIANFNNKKVKIDKLLLKAFSDHLSKVDY